MDDLMKLAQRAGGTEKYQGRALLMQEADLAEFARLIRAEYRERCLSAVRGERLVDAVNCDVDRAYNGALRDAEAAIRALED